MSGTTLALPFALALVVAALGCSPEVPAVPTYTKDVQPILAAHCVRCHGEVLSVDSTTGRMPLQCHLNRYEDTGDCSNAATCSFGAASPTCIGLSSLYITLPDSNARRMPPLPSDQLNDWELEVFKRWSTATPPAP